MPLTVPLAVLADPHTTLLSLCLFHLHSWLCSSLERQCSGTGHCHYGNASKAFTTPNSLAVKTKLPQSCLPPPWTSNSIVLSHSSFLSPHIILRHYWYHITVWSGSDFSPFWALGQAASPRMPFPTLLPFFHLANHTHSSRHSLWVPSLLSFSWLLMQRWLPLMVFPKHYVHTPSTFYWWLIL